MFSQCYDDEPGNAHDDNDDEDDVDNDNDDNDDDDDDDEGEGEEEEGGGSTDSPNTLYDNQDSRYADTGACTKIFLRGPGGGGGLSV